MSGFILTTKSGSIYTFEKNKDNPYHTMSSEKFGKKEVSVDSAVMCGAPFQFTCTDNEMNGDLRGKPIRTSVVEKIRCFDDQPRRLPDVPIQQTGYSAQQGYGE
jgi:hypothetical protein